MNCNSTNPQDIGLSALFIKECRKFIHALNSNCSMEELTELRQRIIQIRAQQYQDDSEKTMAP
ncbi:MAG: hypothetical protein H7122_17790 [Chitinophagaceae bacterium]|nr:hypothetical protein [Chitinophagaceae bacterium]